MLRRQPPSVPQVAPTRHLDQRLPHRVDEIVLEQQMPEAIGALELEVRHLEVERQAGARRRQMEACKKSR